MLPVRWLMHWQLWNDHIRELWQCFCQKIATILKLGKKRWIDASATTNGEQYSILHRRRRRRWRENAGHLNNIWSNIWFYCYPWALEDNYYFIIINSLANLKKGTSTIKGEAISCHWGIGTLAMMAYPKDPCHWWAGDCQHCLDGRAERMRRRLGEISMLYSLIQWDRRRRMWWKCWWERVFQ